MEQLLTKLVGQEIDVVCSGASSLRGKVTKVEDGVLQLKDDDDEICYIAINRIVAVWEKRDKDRHPGFVFKS
jgi:preprotein translocase subunit YajC